MTPDKTEAGAPDPGSAQQNRDAPQLNDDESHRSGHLRRRLPDPRRALSFRDLDALVRERPFGRGWGAEDGQHDRRRWSA